MVLQKNNDYTDKITNNVDLSQQIQYMSLKNFITAITFYVDNRWDPEVQTGINDIIILTGDFT